ncbi:MAG: hypothetical protein KDC26_09195 [Armatimonadetes bacterium]|nr:hypothetical protein [Armatimonadota bacterium]
MKTNKLLLFILAGAFLTMGIEVRYFHAGITPYKPVAWTPIITAALGFLICLVGMFVGKKASKGLGVTMLLLSLSGLAGFYFHHGGDFSHLVHLIQDDYSQVLLEKNGYPAPPELAPLSFTGLSVMAGILLLSPQNKK